MTRLFLWSLLISCTGRWVQSSCPIELSPSRVVVRFGDPLKANCSSTSEVEGIGWESTYGGIGLTTGISSLPFHIPAVKDWIIEPLCYTSTAEENSQCTKTLPVTVYKTPERVSVSKLGNVMEGERISVQCVVVGTAPAKSLSVQWHKGNQIVYRETFDDPRPYPVDRSSVFNLTADRDDDGARFWCEAKLDLGSPEEDPPIVPSQSQTLTVLYPPTFEMPENETVEVEPGKALSINCSATGNPSPSYIWNVPDSVKEIEEYHNQTASMLNLTFPLPGIYTCRAFSSVGSTNKYFTVIEVPGDRTTFAVLIGVFTAVGVALIVAGLIFVTPNGTFAFNKGGYQGGQPSPSAPV